MVDSASSNSLRNLIGEQLFKTLSESKLSIGNAFRIILRIEDGLILMDGQRSKPKRIIIIGRDKENEECYGIVVINTNIGNFSRLTDPPLQSEKYPDIIQHNSFVSTSRIFHIHKEKLLEGAFLGEIKQDDLEIILRCLEETIPTKELKRYGISEMLKSLEANDDI